MRFDEGRRPSTDAAAGFSGGNEPWRADCVFLLVSIAALLIARLPIIPVRFFDQDELEHAHAAWSVFKGLVPYRDFFEHHTPFYYYALAPFFRWFAVDQSFEGARSFLLFARGLSLAITALSAGLIFAMGRRENGRTVGLLTALFLVGQPVLIEKTLEIRPDVAALPFFLGGLWFLLRGLREPDDAAPRSLGWFFGGGLCFGATIMCTQKALFVLPGAFAGLGLWALAGRGRTLRARSVAVLVALVGVAIPFALTWAALAVQGAGELFIRNNFILNAHWKKHSSRNIQRVLETSGPILALAVVGMAVALRRFFRATERAYGDVFLLCTMGGLLAGLFVVPAAYRQYYLMPLPIACLYAAQGLTFLVDRAAARARVGLLMGATLPLLIWPVVDLARSFHQRDEQQTERLRYVFEHTRPSDTVLDGWLGTAVFRPHPLYYFFMHGELLPMLSEAQKDGYVNALESGRVRPSLIVLDEELKALGPRFMQFVRASYVSDDGLFYIPLRPAP